MTPGSQRDVMSSITRSDDSDVAAADVAAGDNLSYLHITSVVTTVDGTHAHTHKHTHIQIDLAMIFSVKWWTGQHVSLPDGKLSILNMRKYI